MFQGEVIVKFYLVWLYGLALCVSFGKIMFNYFGLLGRLGAKLSLRFWCIRELASI